MSKGKTILVTGATGKALMLEWFERVGYGADIAALDAEFGPMTRLDNWAAKTLSA